MTTLQIAMLLGVQLELVRDAAGTCFGRSSGTFTFSEAFRIRVTLVSWGKLAPAQPIRPVVV